MNKYPLSYRLKKTFLDYAIPATMGISIIGVPTTIYQMADGAPSNERTPVIGDAQYVQLETKAKNIVLQDTALQARQKELLALEQQQLINRTVAREAEIRDKQAQITQDLAKLKTNFSHFSFDLINSEGIAETDALHLGKMIEYQTKYAAFNYSYQTSIESKLARLDECQIKSGEKITDTTARSNEIHACIDSHGLNGDAIPTLIIIGAGLGAFGGLILCGIGSPIYRRIEKSTEDQKEMLDKLAKDSDAGVTVKSTVRLTLKPPKQ